MSSFLHKFFKFDLYSLDFFKRVFLAHWN